jgi:hypothetical protein
VLSVKKLGGSDMDGFNPCGNQMTHFIGWVKNLNVVNSTCSCKKVATTFEIRPTICVSSTSEGKTQVGWVVVVKWTTQRCANANNAPPKGSLIVYQIETKL